MWRETVGQWILLTKAWAERPGLETKTGRCRINTSFTAAYWVEIVKKANKRIASVSELQKCDVSLSWLCIDWSDSSCKYSTTVHHLRWKKFHKNRRPQRACISIFLLWFPGYLVTWPDSVWPDSRCCQCSMKARPCSRLSIFKGTERDIARLMYARLSRTRSDCF